MTRRRISTTRIERPVALALGGNEGTPAVIQETLARALRHLEASLGPLRVASLYRTAPVSPVPQPDFLNTAALAYTALPPEEILALAKALDKVEATWDPRPTVGVVLAAGGYPGDYAKGDVIEGLADAAALDGKVFHAGTAQKDGNIVTAGGRVLCATAIGASVSDAQQQAYRLAEKIRWNGCFYRKDIGYRAIARERGEG